MEEKSSKYDRQRRTAYITIVILGAGAVAMGYWWMSLGSLPKISLPINPLPAVNAFNTFESAGKLLQDDKKVTFAYSKFHSGRDPNDRNYTHAEKAELIKENQPAITLFREGLKQNYMTPSYRSSDVRFPYLTNDRRFARLLRVEALVREESGDWRGAMSSHLDSIELGDKLKRGGPMIHALTGVACQAIGQQGMFRLIEHQTIPDSKAELVRLINTNATTPSFTEVLMQEKYSGQALILEFIRKRRTFSELAAEFSVDSEYLSNLQAIKYLVADKKSIFDHYTNYMDQSIANSKHPYSAHLPPPEIPSDPLNEYMGVGGSLGRFSIERSIAANRLLIIGLALKIYKAEHGKYPATLAELVPGVIASLPDDPFALSGAFKYRLEKDKYVLYSVGPDGKDDGGTPIDDKSRISKQFPSSTSRFVPREDSKGDILLGRNVQ